MKKTTKKEVVEVFDEQGHLVSRTTTEETVEEDNSLTVQPYQYWRYCNETSDKTYTNDPDQITMEQFFRGE